MASSVLAVTADMYFYLQQAAGQQPWGNNPSTRAS